MRFASILCLLVLPAAAADLPVRGIHLGELKPAEVPLLVRFLSDAMPKEGANTLVLELNYRYQFQRRPEVAEPDALSRDDLKQIVAACRKAGVRLIPEINCLGHQSWEKTTFGLLRSHPEFDETPGKYPDNKGIYCRSYCPLHPQLHEILFDVIDEIAEAAETDAIHVGMDEVFLLGESDCPRCRGKLRAELFANEVRALHDHLAQSKREMWMWADRFLDGSTGLGEWEASFNGTYPALGRVPSDIVMCDWHYEAAVPTAPVFALAGFPVVSSPWRDPKVALGQLDLIRLVQAHAGDQIASRMRGLLHTSWGPAAAFIHAYYGEGQPSQSAREEAACFRALFAALRSAGH
jgi:hypothetical protein